MLSVLRRSAAWVLAVGKLGRVWAVARARVRRAVQGMGLIEGFTVTMCFFELGTMRNFGYRVVAIAPPSPLLRREPCKVPLLRGI